MQLKLDIGNILKKEREKQNLTLNDIANKTLVRQYYLEQIENNEFKQYDGFINAYIRKYSEALNLDSRPLINAYKALFEEENKPQIPQRSNKRLVYIVILATLIVLISVFAFSKFNKKTALPNDTPSSEQTTSPAEQKPPETENTSTNPSKNKNSAEPSEKKPAGVTVTVSADKLCWIGITIDGKYSQLFIHNGEKKTFKGKKYVKIKFGNATHAYVIVNGKNLGVVSKGKEVMEVTYKVE